MNPEQSGIDVSHLGNNWTKVDEVYVRGSAFFEEDLLSAGEIAERVSQFASASELANFLTHLNGFFAIISVGEVQAFAVDHIRSIPLYYSADSTVHVTDDCHQLADQLGKTDFDEYLEVEYLLTGYVTGFDTLVPDIQQLPAGRVAFFDETNELKTEQYFRYFPEAHESRSQEDLLRELDQTLENATRRLIEYADGRQLAISLSAGYDSRVIFEHLQRQGYENLLAFTYGDEIDAVEQNVDLDGVEWISLRSTLDEYREWYRSDERREFDKSARFLDRTPRIHMSIPIKKLHEHGHFDDDAILLTGDAVQTTGEHIPEEFISSETVTLEQIENELLRRHYRMWDWPDTLDSFVRSRAVEAIGLTRKDKEQEFLTDYAISLIEQWDWKERQSKYMLQNYFAEYWGYDWWFPLWDREFVSFWQTLSTDHRLNKSLYKRYVRQTLDVDTADSTLSRMIARAERTARGLPIIDPLVRTLYYGHLNSTEYGDSPSHGMMTREQFDELQSQNQGSHVFRALNLLGRIDFNPPTNRYPPEDGVIYPRSYYTMNRDQKRTDSYG